MRKLIVFISTVCFCYLASAQTVYFNNTYDFYSQFEVAWNVVVLDTGYLVVGGVGDSITGEGRVGILFIDTLGNEVWKKSYGQSGRYYYPGLDGSLTKTKDGGYALGGSVNYPSGDDNAMLWLFDSAGDTIWTKIYGTDSTTEVGSACHQTPDGGFVIVGLLNEGNGPDIMLIKTDSAGNLEWQNTYGAQFGVSIDVTADSSFIVGGDIYTGNDNTYVLKIDNAGNFQWTENFGGPYDENPGIVRITSDGGYIIATDTALYPYGPVNEEKKLYLIKLDSSGNTQWANAYGKEARVANTLVMARELADGSFIATGQMVNRTDSIENMQGVMVKTNSFGDSLWLRSYIDCNQPVRSHYFRDVQATSDGGFIAVGSRGSDCGNGQDMWVVKTNCLGFDSLPAPAFAADSGTGTTLFFTNMTQNADEVIWYFGDGDSLYAHVGDSAWNPMHTYPGTGTYVVTLVAWACGDTSVFTDTVAAPYVGVEETAYAKATAVKVYPNPAKDEFTITGNFDVPALLELYDVMGRLVRQFTVDGSQFSVDVSELPAGLYIWSIGTARGKVVVE